METNKYMEALNSYPTKLSDSDVLKKVTELVNKNIAENANVDVYKTILSCVDLTSLNASDSVSSIRQLVEKVNTMENTMGELPSVASICIFPNFTQAVRMDLDVSDVNIAVVAGAFPSGQTFTEIKIAEIALAVNDGANEIDVPLPLGDFFSGNYQDLSDEIAEMKAACGAAKLKVILETSELGSAENIKKAALLSIYSGADFIKTSTGKASGGATPLAVYVMCETILEYYKKTGTKIGIKVSGGVNNTAEAVTYYTIVKEVLGKDWLNKELFRIGTSRLMKTLLKDITGAENTLF